jgi:hypothetical protein
MFELRLERAEGSHQATSDIPNLVSFFEVVHFVTTLEE